MRKKQKHRMRKSTKYISLMISSIVLVLSIVGLSNGLSKNSVKIKNKEIYNYMNRYNYSYEVNLKENKYIKDKKLNNNNLTYVTDLIDNINLKLNYEFEGNKEENLKCRYYVTGKTLVTYTNDGEEQKIWEHEEVILEEKEKKETSSKLNIKENIKLDLFDKNTLLNDFETNMGMAVEAKYLVTLNVIVETDVEGKHIENRFSPYITLDLADKITKIEGENNLENGEYISKEFKVNTGINTAMIVLYSIIIIISLLIIRYCLKAKGTNRVRNEFRMELNRILKMCQDKIVQVNSKPNDQYDQEIVFVKDFGEILKISEELFKPILYYYDMEHEEAWFSVMTGNNKYRYILKK